MVESELIQSVVPACLFIIMLGVGMSLTLADFARVVTYPKAVILGLFGQHVLLPLCGFFVAATFVSAPELAIGIVLLAACPGGATSNLITLLARGDLALSISLTAISSVVTFFTIPFLLGIAFWYFGVESASFSFSVVSTITTLFFVTLLPVSLGMAIKHSFEKIAKKSEPYINRFATVFLIFLVVAITIQQQSVLVSAIVSVGIATFLLNALTMSAGLTLAKTSGLNDKQTISIGLEIGIQNSALAMFIATSLLNNSVIAIPAAVYSLVMYLTGGLIIVARRIQFKNTYLSDTSEEA